MANSSTDGKEVRYPRGAYSRIARRLKITPQSVRDVALGIKKSKRISVSLKKELARAAKIDTAA